MSEYNAAETLTFAKAYIEVKRMGLEMTCHKERKLFQDMLIKSDDRFKVFTPDQLKKSSTQSTSASVHKEYSCAELGKTVMRKSCGTETSPEEVRERLVKSGYLTMEESGNDTFYFPTERGYRYVISSSKTWPTFSQAFYDAIETNRISKETKKNNKIVACLNHKNGIEEVVNGKL